LVGDRRDADQADCSGGSDLKEAGGSATGSGDGGTGRVGELVGRW